MAGKHALTRCLICRGKDGSHKLGCPTRFPSDRVPKHRRG